MQFGNYETAAGAISASLPLAERFPPSVMEPAAIKVFTAVLVCGTQIMSAPRRISQFRTFLRKTCNHIQDDQEVRHSASPRLTNQLTKGSLMEVWKRSLGTHLTTETESSQTDRAGC